MEPWASAFLPCHVLPTQTTAVFVLHIDINTLGGEVCSQPAQGALATPRARAPVFHRQGVATKEGNRKGDPVGNEKRKELLEDR